MDVLAHTLWTNALFHLKYHNQRRLRYLAAFFGVVPDLIGFTPLVIYMILSGRIFSGETFPFAATNWTFAFAEHAYNYTHSLVIFAATFIVVMVIGNIYKYLKNGPMYRFWFFWPMLGWALHILIDLPTHPDHYHTPVLFPISEYHFSGGVSWAHPTFMIINYAFLALSYFALNLYQKRKYAKKV